MSDQEVQEKLTDLRCPKCGNDGKGDSQLRYLEDIVCWREVKGVNKHGELEVDGGYQSTEGYDDGDKPRFECMECNHEWPVPDWVAKKIDWV